MDSRNSLGRLSLAWIGLLLIIVAALAIVIVPVWIVQPFKPETERGLAMAYTMRHWSPILTIVALVVSLVLVGSLWRRSRRWFARAILIIMLLPLLGATWFARQNHFEWMFNPLAHSSFAKVPDASFVAESDMVLAVDNQGEAVAYPVRLMAYHHVVQDVVGGTPIVATY
jgi:MFS family permease